MDKFTNTSQNLSKPVMALFALVIGILSGLGCILFRELIGLIHNLLYLGKFSFIYDENLHTPVSIWGPWVIILPMVGAPIVTWLIEHFAYDEKGLSVPEIMYSIHCKEGRVRPKVALAKTLASSISIGSGGSIGREGPMVQLGAALSSLLSDLIKIPISQRIVLIAVGAGATTAAMFDAPIGGILFSFELMLISVSFFNIILLAIATIVATGMMHFILNSNIIFDISKLVTNNYSLSFQQLVVFLPFGILIGLSSIIFIRGIFWCNDVFTYLFKNPYLRHIVGMSLVGIIIYLFMHYYGQYYIEGIGYATINDVLFSMIKDPWLLLLLFFGKLLATFLTLGSGASGGVFSPSLFLGAVLGAFVSILFNSLLPYLNINPLFFVVAGMAGMLGSITGASITAIIIIIEMTKTYQLFVPIIITVITADLVRKILCSESVYTLKLFRRGINYPNCF